MNHIVARASIAFKANEVALDHTDTPVPEIEALHEEAEERDDALLPAQPTPSQRQMRPIPSSKSLKNLRTAAAHTVNLRDCGSISNILRPGRMFRSSQVMRYEEKHHKLPLAPALHFALASISPAKGLAYVAVQQKSQS